jgi:Immunity protein 31
MEPKYQFYEVVRISKQVKHQHLVGLEGAVLGMSQNEQGQWGYAVTLYETGQCWDLSEEDLEPTGRMDKRETFYDGTSIIVTVDPQTGEGRINEDRK